jgi:hypothetical protein
MFVLSACVTPTASRKPVTETRSSDELRNELLARDRSVKALRETAGLKVKTADGKSMTVSINVTLKRPGALKIEFLGPFMEVEGLFVLKEGMYIFLSMPDGTARAGMATAETMGRTLNLPISPDDLEAFFCGTVPESDLLIGAVKTGPGGQSVGLTVRTKTAIKEYKLMPGSLEITRLEVRDISGRVAYTIAFPEHFMVQGRPFPKKAGISPDAGFKSVELKFHDVEINPTVDEAEFQVDVPAGFRFE